MYARAQSVLELAADSLISADSAAGSASAGDPSAARRRSKLASQPGGVVEGFQQALESVRRGLRGTSHTIIAVPMREYARAGAKVRAVHPWYTVK